MHDPALARRRCFLVFPSLLALLLAGRAARAQEAPAIRSFAPGSGPAGTSVTITDTNRAGASARAA